MMHDGSLDDLLWRFSSGEDDARIVGPEEIGRWPRAMLAELKRLALIVEHSPANRVACPACELGHVEDLQFSGDAEHGLHAVIPCPAFGRVAIDDDALRRWRLRDDELTTHLQGTEDRAGSSEVVTWDGTTLTVNRERMATAAFERQANVQGEAQAEPAYMFRAAGLGWQLAFQHRAFFVENLKGMRLLRSLLVHRNTWVAIIDMVPVAECGLEAVDEETLKQVRRLAASGDANANQLRLFLRSVTRRDGTPKRTGGSATRASNAVRMNIRRAINRIRVDNREMADHLDRCVKTGLALSYQCDQEFEWAC